MNEECHIDRATQNASHPIVPVWVLNLRYKFRNFIHKKFVLQIISTIAIDYTVLVSRTRLYVYYKRKDVKNQISSGVPLQQLVENSWLYIDQLGQSLRPWLENGDLQSFVILPSINSATPGYYIQNTIRIYRRFLHKSRLNAFLLLKMSITPIWSIC